MASINGLYRCEKCGSYFACGSEHTAFIYQILPRSSKVGHTLGVSRCCCGHKIVIGGVLNYPIREIIFFTINYSNYKKPEELPIFNACILEEDADSRKPYAYAVVADKMLKLNPRR